MVSIIIPHFNRARLIRETLASVEAQTFGDWEVIVVDDGSNAEERVALEEVASERVRILDRCNGEKGPSRCRNLGAQAARGEFLIFLDSDDLLAPGCLEGRLAAAAGEPEQDLWVFPAANFEHKPGDLDTLWGRMRPGDDDAARFARGDAPWHTSSPVWRRESFLNLGGFNERIVYGDDADLHLRAVLAKLRLRQYPEVAPDAFVRRSAEMRLTNTMNPATLHSRRVRLEEGARLLKASPGGERLLPIWEGQYFVEAEFLLFRVDDPRQAVEEIKNVLTIWKRDCRPSLSRRWLVEGYLRIALATRTRAYLIVRILRRFAKLVLPGEYFGK